MTGTVVWFNEKRGYGFIRTPDQEKDIFVHYSRIQTDDRYKCLYPDQVVEFDIVTTTKGMQAVQVRPKVGGTTNG